ncbi:uncharacterized protein CLUP02_10702 [Colletotrichum lupini]|uniref:Uncharacterized protein n=1 Tax=Colletotrichum lupini TaxID=145971 RepID=A0A9Q8WJT3_9PEZI|nr:uncharacterized protein CLUP02_10702 [Colletotrichum lupini]UQC85205.1 hypothetical protein CLUP02_10702 [Colletotrichum lupini]
MAATHAQCAMYPGFSTSFGKALCVHRITTEILLIFTSTHIVDFVQITTP